MPTWDFYSSPRHWLKFVLSIKWKKVLVKIFTKTSSEFQSVWVLFEEAASNVSITLLHSICPRWPRFVQDHPRWQSGSITRNPQDLFQHAQPLTPSLVHSKYHNSACWSHFCDGSGVCVCGGGGQRCTSVFTRSWNGESHTSKVEQWGKNACFRVGFIAEDVTWTLGTTSLPSFILHEDAISRFLIISSGWNQSLAILCA